MDSFSDLQRVTTYIERGIADEHECHPVEEDVRKFYVSWCSSERRKAFHGMKFISSTDGEHLAFLVKSDNLSFAENRSELPKFSHH